MGGEPDSRCGGAWLNRHTVYQVGPMLVPLHMWPLGQWELGLKDPYANIAEVNGEAKDRHTD